MAYRKQCRLDCDGQQPNTPIQPTTGYTTSIPVSIYDQPRERGKIARPEPFDGSAEKIDIFLRELYLNFEDEASYFQVDHMRKIHFALSYMKEKFAAQWASRITGELEVGARSYQSWEEFCMELLQHSM